MPQLSIVVVSFNEEAHIESLMDAIQSVDNPDGILIETILIDGGSSDKTVDRARDAGFDSVYVHPGANIPTCRNLGAKAASGDWLAYVDADCFPQKYWLVQAQALLKEDEPMIIGWPAEPPFPRTWVQEAWRIHWSFKNANRTNYKGHDVVQEQGFRLVTTRNMLLHRKVFDDVQGFDETLSTGEDTDFVFRAYLDGITVLGVPGLQAIHQGEPATLSAFFKQQLWHANRKSYRRIMEKTQGKLGGNAVAYSVIFTISLIAGLAGVVAAILSQKIGWALLLLPLFAVVGGSALVIALRAKKPQAFLPLAALYTAYGVARSIDLLGLHPDKPSWKS